MSVLDLSNLSIDARLSDGTWLPLVRDVSLTVEAGELAVVAGESGSGKSILLMGALGLLDPDAYRVRGGVSITGIDPTSLSATGRRRLLGSAAGVIFQDPYGALDPVMTIGAQISEAILLHRKIGGRAARSEAIELLSRVGVADADKRYDFYPHEFSGGMRQRVMIAIALANKPSLIVADEPTTALDVTIQAQVVALLKSLQRDLGVGIVFVTHDLALAAEIGDSLHVMYGGMVLERGPVMDVLAEPRHPYTYGLKRSLPDVNGFEAIQGQPVSPGRWPEGCPFVTRCAYGLEECKSTLPVEVPVGAQTAACIRVDSPNPWWVE